MMFKQMDYTMVTVSDMKRSVEFYRDKLGIPLKFESPEWTEFATGTTTLALHGGGVAREYHDTGDQSKIAGACSIGFKIASLDSPCRSRPRVTILNIRSLNVRASTSLENRVGSPVRTNRKGAPLL